VVPGLPRKWKVTEALAKRAERVGSPVLVVAVDVGTPTNWETFLRLRRTDMWQCDSCHGRGPQDFVARRPNYDSIDVSDPASLNIANPTWGSTMRLRDTVKMKIVLKGILTGEDAKLAVGHGIDGIIVSNHGERVVDSGPATIEVCQRSSRRSAAACRCSSTAASGAASISSKSWPSAHGRVYRAPLSVGSGGVWSAGCRAGA
jgi:isopentenyl diphosphate isomerase/L-lactate dehydrogenase-like FMN-dependent dehydrogenase